MSSPKRKAWTRQGGLCAFCANPIEWVHGDRRHIKILGRSALSKWQHGPEPATAARFIVIHKRPCYRWIQFKPYTRKRQRLIWNAPETRHRDPEPEDRYEYEQDADMGIHADEGQWCDVCYGTGAVDCHCGGDLCVCGRNELPCPAGCANTDYSAGNRPGL